MPNNTFPEIARTNVFTTPDSVAADSTGYVSQFTATTFPTPTIQYYPPATPLDPQAEIKTRLAAIEASLNAILEYLEIPKENT